MSRRTVRRTCPGSSGGRERYLRVALPYPKYRAGRLCTCPIPHTSALTHTYRHPISTRIPMQTHDRMGSCTHTSPATAPHRMRARAGGRTYLNLCGGAPGVGGTSYSEVTASSLGPTWGGGHHRPHGPRDAYEFALEVSDAHGGQRAVCSCGKVLQCPHGGQPRMVLMLHCGPAEPARGQLCTTPCTC